MTKHVLLLGVVGVAFYTGIWVVLNGDNEPTPFTRTGPFFQLWFVCLLIAVVSDAFICPAAKRAASAFAALLSNEAGQLACKVTQQYDLRANLRTTTSGIFHGRRTTVLVFQQPRVSYLRLEMVCRSPWVLDIRSRNLASEALAWLGAPLEIGDKALDKAVVIQGDDETTIRKWTTQAEVRLRILSLFQMGGITSLTTVTGSEGEPVLRAYYSRFRPRFFAQAHAAIMLNDLGGLAASAEAASDRR